MIGWARAASVVAVAIASMFAIGCGPSPAYEPDYPQGYYPPPPRPLSAAELQAQQDAQQAQAQGEVAIGQSQDEYGDTDPSALTEWKPVLEGHGAWVDDGTYGTVWVPASSEVGAEFQPYVTAGHWTYSDSTSYVWVSDYDWGWVPFHYGRWVHLSGRGWCWIPGRRYAGAWVTWRTGPSGYGYIGWAPAPPSWYWYNGYAVGWSFGWYHHHDYYVYCPHNNFYHGHVHDHVITGAPAREHYARTQDYVPAQPSVGGGDRVPANPSVNGGDRVAASPSVNARTPASPAVGPKPAELGIKDDAVVAPPTNHQGIARAQAYAAPKTAIAQGAAAPASMRPATSPNPDSRAAFAGAPGGPSAPPVGRTNSPYAGAPSPSPGSGGYAQASPYRDPRPSGVAPSVTPAPYRSPGPSVSPPPSYATPAPYRSPSPSVASPSVSPAPFRSSPSFGSSSPSFRSSSPSVSSPSFRSSSPSVSSPSFRSSPSVSSPSFRSSPSVSPRVSTPSPRVSTPSVSRPSAPSRAAPSVRSGVRR